MNEKFFERKFGIPKERFKGTLRELEKIAQEQGFEGVLIDKTVEKPTAISVLAYRILTKLPTKERVLADNSIDKVLIGEYALQNIRDLFRTNEDFAKEGFAGIFRHEKQHLEGRAGELMKKQKLRIYEILKETKYPDEEQLKKIEEIRSKYKSEKERQAELTISTGY